MRLCAAYGFCARTIVTLNFAVLQDSQKISISKLASLRVSGLVAWGNGDHSKASLLSPPREVPSWVTDWASW